MIIDDIFKEFTNRSVLVTRGDALNFSEHGALVKAYRSEPLLDQYRPPKDLLRQAIGKEGPAPTGIGPHPDFAHLEEGEMEKHYIVSVFVDIKGSTLLGLKLPLEQVRVIKNGILTVAIDMVQAFGGHVHRLQGDALFALFGGKGIAKADAIIDALNATTFLQTYFKQELGPRLFDQLGLPTTRIRIGIDFGDDDKVLWSKYGIHGCYEVTTTSVHTDLAAKLQQKAPGNGTMIGHNVVEFLDLPPEFYTVRVKQEDKQKVQLPNIIENELLTYPMWVFNWERYINKFPMIHRTSGDYDYQSPADYEVRCYYKRPEDDTYSNEYRSNCSSLEKGLCLNFELTIKDPGLKYDEIIWQVKNRGQEATTATHLDFEVEEAKDKKVCHQTTAYLGHHYMVVTLKFKGRVVAKEFFGIYVRD